MCLYLQIPDHDPVEVKVPLEILNNLTSDTALELVSANEEFRAALAGRTISHSDVHITPGVKAKVNVRVLVHEHDRASVKEARARAKEASKLMKAEKKKQRLEKRQMKDQKSRT